MIIFSDNEMWIVQIFDKKKHSIRKYNVEAMFLQLIAADIIGIEKNNNTLMWTISRQGDYYSPPRYCMDECWSGIDLIELDKRKHPLMD